MSNDEIIARAIAILESRARYDAISLTAPSAVKDLCRLRLGAIEHEVFVAIWLDAQNRMIDFDEMFRGTITQTSVYPRELVKQALAKNAASVILAHNHPSGIAEPSRADEAITKALKDALTLVDVRVLDHIIVSASSAISFAERGLL